MNSEDDGQPWNFGFLNVFSATTYDQYTSFSHPHFTKNSKIFICGVLTSSFSGVYAYTDGISFVGSTGAGIDLSQFFMFEYRLGLYYP